jgi:hypothetical protein
MTDGWRARYQRFLHWLIQRELVRACDIGTPAAVTLDECLLFIDQLTIVTTKNNAGNDRKRVQFLAFATLRYLEAFQHDKEFRRV